VLPSLSAILPVSQSACSILFAMISPLELITTFSFVLTPSFSPEIASGTILDTSCAKKPSTVVSLSAIKLNLAGFNCFNLDVASKS
jgi:hypothetical protein